MYIHDITHCKNNKCKDKEKCYRWLAYQEILEHPTDGLISVFQRDCETKCKDFMSVDLKQ